VFSPSEGYDDNCGDDDDDASSKRLLLRRRAAGSVNRLLGRLPVNWLLVKLSSVKAGMSATHGGMVPCREFRSRSRNLPIVT